MKTKYLLILGFVIPSTLFSQVDSLQFVYPKYEVVDASLRDILGRVVNSMEPCLDSLDGPILTNLYVSFYIENSNNVSEPLGDTVISVGLTEFRTWPEIGPRYIGVLEVKGRPIFIRHWPPAMWFIPTLESEILWVRMASSYGEDTVIGEGGEKRLLVGELYYELGCEIRIKNGKFYYRENDCDCD